MASKYNTGSKGRKKKLCSLEQYRKLESHYVTYRIHQYTRALVNYCIKARCGIIILKKQLQKEIEAKSPENIPFVLRNWGYYGLKAKLKYKCDMVGIELREE